MGAKRQKGQGKDAEVMRYEFDDTTAFATSGDDMREYDSVGAQLISEFASTEFTADDTDDVTALTKTWNIAGYTFTGQEGATLRVSGSETSDGDYEIDTVTSAHIIVTVTGPADDEGFTDAVEFTVLRTDDPPTGDWKVEVSNNFVPNTNSTVYSQPSNAGDWTDITTEFSPSITGVTTAGSQYVQADLTARDIRWTFTPSAGQGTAIVRRFCKSWS